MHAAFEPSPRSAPPRPSLLLPALLLVALAALLWQAWPHGAGALHDPDARARPVVDRGPLTHPELATIDVFEANRGSVVHISTHTQLGGGRLRVPTPRQFEQGVGSGIVWDAAGYVLTNYHVLQGAERATVTLAGGERCEGFFVGGDPDHDLAVLKVQPPSALRPVQLGSSRDLRIGQSVIAIGNPFGLDWTLTTGVVSGLERVIESVSRRRIEGVIQTDAAINPGNSGGPLLDSAGRLIGIVTAIYVPPSGTSAGISFAVPVDLLNEVVPALIAGGRPERAGLGILMFPDSSARRAGLSGVAIEEVTPGSAAETAGLRSYSTAGGREEVDVIVALDGEPVRSQADLRRLLATRAIGDRVRLAVERETGRAELEVVLQDVR